MKTSTVIIFCFLLNGFYLTGQNAQLDSLRLILRGTKEDAGRLKAMNILGKELYKKAYYDSATYYSDVILNLSDKLLKNAKNKDEASAIKDEIIRAYQLKGNIYLDHGQYQECLNADSAAIRLCMENNNKLYLAGCYITIGTVFLMTSDYPESRKNDSLVLKYATEALSELQNSNNYEWIRIARRYIAVAINNIGNSYKRQGNYKDALEMFLQAKKAFEDINDRATLAICLYNIGTIYQSEGDYGEALENETDAMKIQEDIGDKLNLSATYSQLGMIYLHSDNFAEALGSQMKALTLQEQIGNKAGVGFSYLRIGDIYLRQRNYSEAMNNYLQSMKIFQETGDKNGQTRCAISLGNIYRIQNEYPKAYEVYNNALELAEGAGDKLTMSDITNNLGTAYDEQKNYSEALKYYKKTLTIKLEINEKFGIAAVYVNIGNALLHQGKYKEAKPYYLKALAMGKEMNETEVIREDYRSLAALAEREGDYKMALHYFENYSDAKDSSFNDDINKQIAQMKTQYETEKKDNEIKLLNTDKRIQAAELVTEKNRRRYMLGGFSLLAVFSGISIFFYNQKRRTAFNRTVTEVEMKALRAQMNPHFIFNSLNSIHTFLLQNDGANASEYLLKFSRLMRLILENSREMEVPLEKDLEALELYMQLEALRLNNKFYYEISVDPEINRETTLIPPMLLQPYIENSIWHGFQDKAGEGKITINISRRNNMLFCSLEDNGVGRHKSATINLTQKDKGESLGTKITDARINIINKIKKANARVRLIDLTQGLRVELFLPFEQAF